MLQNTWKYHVHLHDGGQIPPHMLIKTHLHIEHWYYSSWESPLLWGTLEPCFRVLSSPAAHTHSLIEPICKLTPHHSPALPRAPQSPHSLFFLCVSQSSIRPPHHTSNTQIQAATSTRTQRRQTRKEVSGSPQRQRTTWGAMTSLHFTQLPVFDYWLLWQCVTVLLNSFHQTHFLLVFAFLYRPQSVWFGLIISSISSFTISLVPGNNYFTLSLHALLLHLPLSMSVYFLPFRHL